MASPVASPSGSLTSWRLPIEGRAWLVLTGLLLALALLKTINLLALVGCCLLAAFLLNAVAAGKRLKKLRASHRLADALIAGQPCPIDVEVRNTSRRDVVGVRFELTCPDRVVSWFAARLSGQSVARSFRATVVPPQRGRGIVGPLVAERGHPMGLVLRRRVLLPAEEVVVWPSLGTLDRARFRRWLVGMAPPSDRQRGRPRPHPMAQTEFYGLRAYRPGDSPRSIHWRSSARRGELMVRECEEHSGEDLVLIFDPTMPAQDLDAFEAAVSFAATLCRTWCKRPADRLVLVIAGPEAEVLDGTTGPQHERRLLNRLAVLASGPSGVGSLREVLGRLRVASASLVLLSAGASDLAGPSQRGLTRPVHILDAATAVARGFYQPPATLPPVKAREGSRRTRPLARGW